MSQQDRNTFWINYLKGSGQWDSYQAWAHQMNSQRLQDTELPIEATDGRVVNSPVGVDYNYALSYLFGDNPATDGHLSDIGKLPNHPTFSNESAYAPGRSNAGMWEQMPKSGGEDWRYTNPSRGLFLAPEQQAYQGDIPPYNPQLHWEPPTIQNTPVDEHEGRPVPKGVIKDESTFKLLKTLSDSRLTLDQQLL